MNINPHDTYIVSAKRSAIGKFGGTLREECPYALGAAIIKSGLVQAQLQPEEIDQIIVGRCFGADNRKLIQTGDFPDKTISTTVYMACGSGMMAVQQGHRLIQLNEATTAVTGGLEHMSGVPHIVRNLRWGRKFGSSSIEDQLALGLSCPITGISMGQTAENIQKTYGISRSEQDEFALWSQEKALKASRSDRFTEEIAPFELSQPKDSNITFVDDEQIRETSAAQLAELKPAFEKQGTVTAGNSSSLNDGAAFLTLASGSFILAGNTRPLARVVSIASSGINPSIMGMGPVSAMESALKKAGLRPEQISLYEVNEAFAVQVLGVLREFPIPPEKLNVNGGAIALGHPVGCSGARILVTLLYELKLRNQQFGMASLCVGGGMGIATIIENFA